jgi:proteasome lid subunit RPN8/RPN11
LSISKENCQAMLAHCLVWLPEEACGLLGGVFTDGSGASVQSVLPVANALHSPVRFRMQPEDQLKAFLWLEEQGQELVAMFHSHPTGPDHPSPTDLAEFAYPGVFSIILSPRQPGLAAAEPASWQVRAFQIEGDPLSWSEVSIRGVDQPNPE